VQQQQQQQEQHASFERCLYLCSCRHWQIRYAAYRRCYAAYPLPQVVLYRQAWGTWGRKKTVDKFNKMQFAFIYSSTYQLEP
jgi:hypothetical protein